MLRLATIALATAALAAGAAAQTGAGARREATPAAKTAAPTAKRLAPQVGGVTGPKATTVVNLSENECTTLGGTVHSGAEVGDVCISGKICRRIDEHKDLHLVCITATK